MSSFACAIPDLVATDTVVITGGWYNRQVVVRYDKLGHARDLPQLIVKRYWHGCGAYLRLDGTQVSVGRVCVCVCGDMMH